MAISFIHLNKEWNAEPNAPHPRVKIDGSTLELSFLLNPWAYTAFEGEVGAITLWDAAGGAGTIPTITPGMAAMAATVAQHRNGPNFMRSGARIRTRCRTTIGFECGMNWIIGIFSFIFATRHWSVSHATGRLAGTGVDRLRNPA